MDMIPGIEGVNHNPDPNNSENAAVTHGHTEANNTNRANEDVNSDRLLRDIISRSYSDDGGLDGLRSGRFETYRRRFFGTIEDVGNNGIPARRFLALGVGLAIILFLLFINSYNSADSDNPGDSIVFSTYYTSKYKVCVPPEMNKKHLAHSMLCPEEAKRDEKKCAEGNVDITLFYKDVNLEGYYRVYLGLSFELDYQGRWYEVWKDKHFFSTKHKNKRLVLSLSNLIYVDNNLYRPSRSSGGESTKGSQKGDGRTGVSKTSGKPPINTNEAQSVNIYLSSFIPNFINMQNYKVKDNGGSYKERYNIYKYNNKLINSIRLNDWNEFAKLFNIYNYNMTIDLKVDPMEYMRSTINLKTEFGNLDGSGKTEGGGSGEKEEESSGTEGVSGMGVESETIEEKPKLEKISFRKLDEYYVMNIRKFVHNEYDHIADFNLSWFNIFNVFKTTNPYSTYFKVKLDNRIVGETKPNDESKGGEHDKVLSKDILNVYFNPVNKYEVKGETKNVVEAGTGGEKTTGTKTESEEERVEDIVGDMDSNDVPVSVSITGKEKDMNKLNTMIFRFSVVFILKCLLETILVSREFKKIDRAAQGQSVSITSICLMTYQEILEVFLLLYHGGVFFDNLLYFGFVMFVKFFLLGIVQHSFIVVIWRSNHSYEIRQGWNEIQKSFTMFYRYYFTFITLLLVIWYFYYSSHPFVICLVYLVWFPQILLDVWRGQNNSLNFLFIVASVLLKLVLPVYTFCVRDNIFNYDQFTTDTIRLNPSLVYFLVFLNSVQLILISVQRLYGARYFASWSILPKIYSYVRPWSKMMQDDPQECVICMYDIVQTNRDWVLTPCDHLFHANCLKEWTEIKLECPNCRRPLPPITQL